jgi:hypothetical protein
VRGAVTALVESDRSHNFKDSELSETDANEPQAKAVTGPRTPNESHARLLVLQKVVGDPDLLIEGEL